MNNFTLGRYLPMDSPIHKMDPRAKIGAMLIALIAIFFPAGWIGYAVIFAVVACVIILSKLSWGFIWKAMKPMMFMLISVKKLNSRIKQTLLIKIHLLIICCRNNRCINAIILNVILGKENILPAMYRYLDERSVVKCFRRQSVIRG